MDIAHAVITENIMLSAFATLFSLLITWVIFKPKGSVVKTKWAENTVVLFGFPRPRNPALGNISPFVIKVEGLLRLLKVPYVFKGTFRMQKSPTGKIPWIEMNADFKLGDSSAIAEWIRKEFDDIDKELSVEQQAISNAFQKYLEEYFYFIGIYMRWFDDSSCQSTFQFAFAPYLTWYQKLFVKGMVQNSMKETLFKQGMSRLGREEILRKGRAVVDDVGAFLGNKTFFMGLKKPTTIDLVIYAFSIQAREFKGGDKTIDDYLLSKSNLRDHCERMHQLAYPGGRYSDSQSSK